MDFGKLDLTAHADKGAVLQVLHPVTKEPLEGVTITLLGQDSKVYRKKVAESRQKAVISKSTFSLVDADNEFADRRVDVTKSWAGIEENKKPVECTPENARYMYEKYDWLADQVDTFIMERANFFPKADAS